MTRPDRAPAATPRQQRSPRSATSRHLSITDVCEDLDITRSTFYDWRAKRKAPPCFKLPNGDLRIRRSDYEDWLLSLEAA